MAKRAVAPVDRSAARFNHRAVSRQPRKSAGGARRTNHQDDQSVSRTADTHHNAVLTCNQSPLLREVLESSSSSHLPIDTHNWCSLIWILYSLLHSIIAYDTTEEHALSDLTETKRAAMTVLESMLESNNETAHVIAESLVAQLNIEELYLAMNRFYCKDLGAPSYSSSFVGFRAWSLPLSGLSTLAPPFFHVILYAR